MIPRDFTPEQIDFALKAMCVVWGLLMAALGVAVWMNRGRD